MEPNQRNPADQYPAGVILSVPFHLIDRFRGHRLVVRSDDPRSFSDCQTGDGTERIEFLQLTDLEADPSPLLKWETVFPLDLVLAEPGREFPRLYAFAPLLDRGPVRVSVAVADGVEKAVKLAASLRFSVKIIPGQPEVEQVTRLIRLADFYLRNPTIEEPIEFFHSLFFALVNNEATTLWDILEKDPARYRWVTDDGRVADGQPWPLSDAAMTIGTGAETSADAVGCDGSPQPGLMNRYKACVECTYLRWCRGFFKYPAPDYSCEPVLPLFQHLFAAAAEFKQDLAAAPPGTGP
jgi:hypothetical protein